ncbi:MarR family transcriptional regulator [Paenibacillus sp. M1]|uniref:MarR family transcriptional regulator n=1 Tax=Paenibacillus haidiansis TaxID=1574488 RepID=A0ABU7VPA2_9BACL
MGERQQAIIKFIAKYKTEHGYPPSNREIQAAVGLASVSTVNGHIDRLEKNGFITRKTDSPRTITLTDKGLTAAQ